MLKGTSKVIFSFISCPTGFPNSLKKIKLKKNICKREMNQIIFISFDIFTCIKSMDFLHSL